MSGAATTSMQPISNGLRAYFAPVRREEGLPAIFDPAKHGNFDLDQPPAPWIDTGWVEGLRRTSGMKFGVVRRGKRAAAAAQYRSQLDARIEFEFREWGKVQMALSAGSEHLNVLESVSGGVDGASGGAAIGAAGIRTGSTASEIVLGASDLARFAAGDIIAVDEDYQQQTGYIGTGIAGSYVASASELSSGPDYIRRVTFNVARVVNKTATSLLLDKPLAGGDPAAGAGVQKVVAFADREGGKFMQEWSALFVLPEVSGGRICLYYPRLQPAAGAAESELELSGGMKLNSLKAAFTAMPYTDEIDGEPVLCYRTYVPAEGAGL